MKRKQNIQDEPFSKKQRLILNYCKKDTHVHNEQQLPFKPKVNLILLQPFYTLDYFTIPIDKVEKTFDNKRKKKKRVLIYASGLYSLKFVYWDDTSYEKSELVKHEFMSEKQNLERQVNDNILSKRYYGKKEVLYKNELLVKRYKLIWWNFEFNKTNYKSDIVILFNK